MEYRSDWLQGDIKFSMKRNARNESRESLYTLFFPYQPVIWEGQPSWLSAAERDHNGFLFNFPLDAGGREKGSEIEYLSPTPRARTRRREKKKDKRKKKGNRAIDAPYAWSESGMRRCRTAFGNSEDIREIPVLRCRQRIAPCCN